MVNIKSLKLNFPTQIEEADASYSMNTCTEAYFWRALAVMCSNANMLRGA